MNLLKKVITALLVVLIFHPASQAQLLKKLKQKVNSAINKNVSSEVDPATSSNQSGKPANTKGGGLTNTTPPDVKQQIADAEKSQAAGNYSDARYSIQQAMMGVELQIGKEILQTLPATVDGLEKDSAENKVMSTQWGWNNLTIQSIYKKGDKQMTVTIGNSGFYGGLASLYFNNGAYMQTTSDGNNQNVKQTKLKGYKAVITFEESKGYTLLVSIGQSSLIGWECINFATEQEVMTAAGSFDIDKIKKMLGEQ